MKAKPVRAKEFNSKLAAYSATATVALLAAPAADATIDTITTFSYNNGSTFDTTPPSLTEVNKGGHLYFTAGVFRGGIAVTNKNTNMSIFGEAEIGVKASAHHGLILDNGSFPTDGVARLNLGDPIVGDFGGLHVLADPNSPGGSSSKQNQFLPVADGKATGYVGFEQKKSGHTYYGWLRVSVTADANDKPDSVSLVAKAGDPGIYGAYGLASDDITAGQIAAVPEPSLAVLGGLGLLALGAAGVREMRRRKIPGSSI